MGSAKSVRIGALQFGGGARVRVEGMVKTPLGGLDGCVAELESLRHANCELVRVAFPDDSFAPALRRLIGISHVPIMADIHFNHKFTLAALDSGVASVRVNPGNMSGEAGLRSVLAAAKMSGAVIRIGANGGSLSGRHLESCGGDRAAAIVFAVEEQLRVLTDAGFEDIIISAKSSSVMETVRANALLADRYPFPLHIGITEAGMGMAGAVKSACGLGILLSQGIGDTMRVSLTGDSVTEVEVAYAILRSLEIRNRGVNLISCPCCGRRRVDVGALVSRVKECLPDNPPDGLTIAVMGCEVNGPREAAAADIGIAGTKNGFALFERGRPVATGGLGDIGKVISERIKRFMEINRHP